MKITYRVLSGASAKSLEEQVDDLAKDGYVPQGGVSVVWVSYPAKLSGATPIETYLFSQAMAKVEEV